MDFRSVRSSGGCYGASLFELIFRKIIHSIRPNHFSHCGVHVLGAGGHFISTPYFHPRHDRSRGVVQCLWLRNAIARERGIAAYRAWLPLERIRPASIPQSQWEETFAWPPDNRPPYPSLPYRALRGVASYLLLFAIVAALLQFFTPFPVVSWLTEVTRMLTHVGAG